MLLWNCSLSHQKCRKNYTKISAQQPTGHKLHDLQMYWNRLHFNGRTHNFSENVKGLRYFPTLLRLKPLSYIQALCHPSVTTLIVQKTHKFENGPLCNDADAAPVYPEGFTLEIDSGENYAEQGNVVTPDNGFAGRLSVRVRVNDGENNSDRFDLQIDVTGSQSVAPKITGQVPLSVNGGASLTVDLSHLQVTDPDNSYPNGFTLKLFTGNNYSLNGNTVTPSPEFLGQPKSSSDCERRAK